MFRHYLQPFYNIADSGGGSDTLTGEDIFNALNTDNDSKDDDQKNDDKFDLSLDATNDDDEDDSDDEDEEVDNDSEESDDKEEDDKDELILDAENEDEIELAKIPTRQELKKYDPELFKKFPQLEHALFREKQYSEIYPTIADAKASKESVEAYNRFQHELLSGNATNVLKTVKSTDPKAFDKLVNGFLDSLTSIDGNAHLPITRQVTKGILNYIHSAASNTLKKAPDDKRATQLQIAAELIHEAIFDTTEVTPDRVSKETEENPEAKKLREDREAFDKTRYTAAYNDVSSRTNNRLTKAVTNEVDPKGIFTPYVKGKLVNDIMSTLDKNLMEDTRFRSLIDKLWMRSKEAGFSSESKDAIHKALIEKAKTVLPGIIRAKKAEALKGLSGVKKETGERKLTRTTNGKDRSSRNNESTRSNRPDPSKPRDDESVLDFLMRD